MAKKRGPKMIFACLRWGDFERGPHKAEENCARQKRIAGSACKGCPGPVKYVREDK